ncbi:hypothetical protein KSS87_006234 [Heliosperma pusillum]|nr:hypothetical protein KSS87_006234 [Heliosperma pusillum]
MAAIDKTSRSNRKKQQRSKSSKPSKPSFGPNKQLNKKKNNNNNKQQHRHTSFIKLLEELNQDACNLGTHLKSTFESTWKKVLCEPQLVEGQIDAGNPAVMVISASAIKSLDMLRGLRILTKECQAVKLFSKHIKVDEQVAMLKKRVNIASGTPSRIKKLAEMEALGLSRLSVIVLDMHTDVKGYSLFTLPQVRDEFWDLYKCYFHERILQGDLRVCLYGPISATTGRSTRKSEDQ